MELIHRIDCPDGRDCPAVHTTSRRTIVLSANRLRPDEQAQMNLPNHETGIEMTPEELEELYRAYRASAG